MHAREEQQTNGSGVPSRQKNGWRNRNKLTMTRTEHYRLYQVSGRTKPSIVIRVGLVSCGLFLGPEASCGQTFSVVQICEHEKKKNVGQADLVWATKTTSILRFYQRHHRPLPLAALLGGCEETLQSAAQSLYQEKQRGNTRNKSTHCCKFRKRQRDFRCTYLSLRALYFDLVILFGWIVIVYQQRSRLGGKPSLLWRRAGPASRCSANNVF